MALKLVYNKYSSKYPSSRLPQCGTTLTLQPRALFPEEGKTERCAQEVGTRSCQVNVPGCKDNNQSNRDLWRKRAQQDHPFCRHRLQAPSSPISAVRTEQVHLAFPLLPPWPPKKHQRKKLTKERTRRRLYLILGKKNRLARRQVHILH